MPNKRLSPAKERPSPQRIEIPNDYVERPKRTKSAESGLRKKKPKRSLFQLNKITSPVHQDSPVNQTTSYYYPDQSSSFAAYPETLNKSVTFNNQVEVRESQRRRSPKRESSSKKGI